MRQNMEELTATQEEMQRILKEVQGSEEYVSGLLNVSTDSIFTLDRELKLLSFNKVFGATFESRGIGIGKGFDILSSIRRKRSRSDARSTTVYCAARP